jgi:hypothetical protein
MPIRQVCFSIDTLPVEGASSLMSPALRVLAFLTVAFAGSVVYPSATGTYAQLLSRTQGAHASRPTARELLLLAQRQLILSHSFTAYTDDFVAQRLSRASLGWEPLSHIRLRSRYFIGRAVAERMRQAQLLGTNGARPSHVAVTVKVGSTIAQRYAERPWHCSVGRELTRADVLASFGLGPFVRVARGDLGASGVKLIGTTDVHGQETWHVALRLSGNKYRRVFGSEGLLVYNYWITKSSHRLLRAGGTVVDLGPYPRLRIQGSSRLRHFGTQAPIALPPACDRVNRHHGESAKSRGVATLDSRVAPLLQSRSATIVDFGNSGRIDPRVKRAWRHTR